MFNNFLTAFLIVNIFFFIRNLIIYRYVKFGIKLIYEYIKAIPMGEYEINRKYYNEMMINTFKLLFKFWLWGKYSAIKPEFREMLKQYECLIDKKPIKKGAFKL